MALYSIDFDYETDSLEGFIELEKIERFLVPALPQHLFNNNNNNNNTTTINYNELNEWNYKESSDSNCDNRPRLKRSLSPCDYYWLDMAVPNVK